MELDRSELRRTLGELKGEVQEFLERLIEFPSTYGNDAEAVAFLEGRWADAEFVPVRHPIDDGLMDDPEYSHAETDVSFEGRDNLVVRSGAGDGGSLIVNAHVDVVPAGDWAEAFEPVVEGGRVTGRGACDDKGQMAVMFLAAVALRQMKARPAGEVIYQMVVDEEVGGNGSLALIREGMTADGVVVLEPTGLAMHPANRGAIWFRFDFEGRPCHMGRKHEGVSAIDLACETIGLLYEYEKELVRDAEDQPLFAHYDFPTQVNVGVLGGGEWPSMVPANAVMEGGVGFLPNRSMAQVKEDLVRCIEQGGSEELKKRYGLSFPKLHNDSYETPVDHAFVQAFHEATLETSAESTITGWNVSCDARLFARLEGIPTVVFGPGRIEDAHSAGEQIDMADVLTAAETMVLFIERWCGLAPDS